LITPPAADDAAAAASAAADAMMLPCYAMLITPLLRPFDALFADDYFRLSRHYAFHAA